MILSGEKPEEYREIKEYWIRRFCARRTLSLTAFAYRLGANWEVAFRWRHWDEVIFTNGYSKNARTMRVKIKNARIGEGYSVWGAEPNKQYFVFELGEILETSNV